MVVIEALDDDGAAGGGDGDSNIISSIIGGDHDDAEEDHLARSSLFSTPPPREDDPATTAQAAAGGRMDPEGLRVEESSYATTVDNDYDDDSATVAFPLPINNLHITHPVGNHRLSRGMAMRIQSELLIEEAERGTTEAAAAAMPLVTGGDELVGTVGGSSSSSPQDDALPTPTISVLLAGRIGRTRDPRWGTRAPEPDSDDGDDDYEDDEEEDDGDDDDNGSTGAVVPPNHGTSLDGGLMHPRLPIPHGASDSTETGEGGEGLRRIMNRLMFHTVASRAIFPPTFGNNENGEGENNVNPRPIRPPMMGRRRGIDENFEDVLDFFGLFDATAFNRPTDVRRQDKLTCPTCMKLHLPVEGSERICIPSTLSEDAPMEEGMGMGVDGGVDATLGNNEGVDVNEDDSHESTLPPLLSDIESSDEEDETASLDTTRRVEFVRNFAGHVPVQPSTTSPPSSTQHAAPPQDRPALLPSMAVPRSASSPASDAFSENSSYYSINNADEERSQVTTDDDEGDGELSAQGGSCTDDDDDDVDEEGSLFYDNSYAVAMNEGDDSSDESSSSMPLLESMHREVDAMSVPDAATELVVVEDVIDEPTNVIEGSTDNAILAAEENRLFEMEMDAFYSNANRERGGDESSTTGMPALVLRDDINENGDEERSSESVDDSMPELVQREEDTSRASSPSYSSIPSLMHHRDLPDSDSESSTPPLMPSRPTTTRHDRFVDYRTMVRTMFLPPVFDAAPTGGNMRGNNDGPSHPITHLRDFGALRVYAKSICPVCLEDYEPIVALPCGHCLCEEDYKMLGGYLASDKEKLRLLMPQPAPTIPQPPSEATIPGVGGPNLATSTTQTPAHQDMGRWAWSARSQTRSAAAIFHGTHNGVATLPNRPTVTTTTMTTATTAGESETTIPAVIVRRRPRLGPRVTPRPKRGYLWAGGLTHTCENLDCTHRGVCHRVLYSVSKTILLGSETTADPVFTFKHQACFNNGSRFFPDGCGGVYILEEQSMSVGPDWPLWHINKCGKKTKKFDIPRNTDLISDGNGGLWALTRPEWEDINNYLSEIIRYVVGNDGSMITQHRAFVPRGSKMFYAGGRGGQVWLYAEDEEVYSLDRVEDVLPPGLWLVGSHTMEKHGERCPQSMGILNGCFVEPDGKGGLWYLENDRTDLDALVLKHIDHSGNKFSTLLRFPKGQSLIYGCASTDGVFIFYMHTPPNPADHSWRAEIAGVPDCLAPGLLTYVSKNPETCCWDCTEIHDVPAQAKFVGDGAGGLYAVMDDEGGRHKLWKANFDDTPKLVPLNRWQFPIRSTVLISG